MEIKKYPYPWGPWAKKPELKRIGAVSACLLETGLEVSCAFESGAPGGPQSTAAVEGRLEFISLSISRWVHGRMLIGAVI